MGESSFISKPKFPKALYLPYFKVNKMKLGHGQKTVTADCKQCEIRLLRNVTTEETVTKYTTVYCLYSYSVLGLPLIKSQFFPPFLHDNSVTAFPPLSLQDSLSLALQSLEKPVSHTWNSFRLILKNTFFTLSLPICYPGIVDLMSTRTSGGSHFQTLA